MRTARSRSYEHNNQDLHDTTRTDTMHDSLIYDTTTRYDPVRGAAQAVYVV